MKYIEIRLGLIDQTSVFGLFKIYDPTGTIILARLTSREVHPILLVLVHLFCP